MTAATPSRRPGAVLNAMMVVSTASGAAMLVGFLKSVLAAYYFGTSGAMDAYVLALLLPDVAMQLARTGAFNFIPLFAAEHARSETDAWRAAGKMLTYWLLLLLATVLLTAVVAPLIMPMVAPGLSTQSRAVTLSLVRVLLLMAASVGAGRILAVVLHAERRFLAAGLAEVAFQVGSIAFLVVGHGLGIEALAWAQVFGGFLQFLVVALALRDRRHRLRMELDLRSGPVRKLIRLTIPVYIGDSGDKVNLLVTRAFASLLPAGAVSALQFAYIPVEGLFRIFASSVPTALLPFLSGRFAEPDQSEARRSLGQAVVVTTALFLPLAVAVGLLAGPLVVLLFERGSFDVSSTRLTAAALRLFAPSVAALALNELFTFAFHARQDTMTPMRAGLVRVASNALLCAVLAPSLGHRGLALATTLSLYFKLLFLILFVRRLFTAAELRAHLRALGRVAAAVAVMASAAAPVAHLASTARLFPNHAVVSLAAAGLACLMVYVAALWLFARNELGAYRALLHPTPPPPLPGATPNGEGPVAAQPAVLPEEIRV